MKKKWMMFFLCLFLTGCSANELERRCFPQVVVVGYEDENVEYRVGFPKVSGTKEREQSGNDYYTQEATGDSFARSKSNYESRLSQDADYNHLKVFVVEREFLEEKKQYLDMLSVLSMTEAFPRNTYVCVVDDAEDLMEVEGTISQDLGTYIEEYLQNHEKNKGYMITLGDLIDEKENEKLIVYLPYLEVKDTFVEWNGYYAIGSR